MELASAGVRVDLYDRSDRCVSQASAQNEGKIHLGYVYANDPTLKTARAMIRGGLSFAPLMRRWIGREIDAVPVSTPFYYVVHKESLLTVEQMKSHLRAAQALAVEEECRADYFGVDYRKPIVRLSRGDSEALCDGRNVSAVFVTPEIAIDPEALAAKVRQRLASDPNIRCVLRTQVQAASPGPDEVRVEFERDGSRHSERYDHVVNALWDGRLAIDRTAGVHPGRPWIYRVKHYLRLRTRGLSDMPSVTIVLGAFGDTVRYSGHDFYLSWYPAGMRGSSHELIPPNWPLELDDMTRREVREGIIAGLERIVPAVGKLHDETTIESSQVRGGIIFAWGQTDIHDPASALHQRHAIGPQSHGRYHTIDTGKLTTAPMFAKQVADVILGRGC